MIKLKLYNFQNLSMSKSIINLWKFEVEKVEDKEWEGIDFSSYKNCKIIKIFI